MVQRNRDTTAHGRTRPSSAIAIRSSDGRTGTLVLLDIDESSFDNDENPNDSTYSRTKRAALAAASAFFSPDTNVEVIVGGSGETLDFDVPGPATVSRPTEVITATVEFIRGGLTNHADLSARVYTFADEDERREAMLKRFRDDNPDAMITNFKLT